MSAEGVPNLVGRTLDGYKVLRLLGAGGMGAVFEALEEKLGRKVALKVMRTEARNVERLVKRFFREAMALARLTHPNTTALYNYGSADGFLYMALELVQGTTLADEIAKGPLPLDRALRVALGVLAGLEAAHGLGIVHRDLKPENLMLVPDPAGERVKILDFGLAKDLNVEVDGGITAPGSGLGTLLYMAPEQLDNALMADERSDLYSVGVVLVEMLTAKNPYDFPTTRQIVLKKLNGPPPSVRAMRPDVPEAIEQVIHRALEPMPDGRFASARAFADALAAARDGRAPPPARPALAPTVEKLATPPSEGRVVGSYRLGRRIALARGGEFFAATDLAFDRPVLVKVAPGGQPSLERLRKESLLLNRVGAEVAFEVVDTGLQGDEAYLVLLGADGQPLPQASREKRGPIVERAIACGVQLLEALGALHAIGVVHRDVTAANVLVAPSGEGERFRLLDFSLAADPTLAGSPLDARNDLGAVSGVLRSMFVTAAEPLPAELASVIDSTHADAKSFAKALEAIRAAPSAPRRPPSAHEGALLGRYKLEERLGQGTLGEVYRARQIDLRRPVAVRVLAAELAKDLELVRALVDGARGAARVVHPGVAFVHEIGTAPILLATELVSGTRLAEALRAGPLAVSRAASVAAGLLDALAAAHEAGVVHGALAPRSVVLVGDAPKLVDLGLGAARDLALAKRGAPTTRDASRSYFAPELASGAAPDAAGDVFAVACMLVEMLTGQPADLLARSPRRKRPEIPDALDAAVVKALAPRPENRFASARELAAALRQCALA